MTPILNCIRRSIHRQPTLVVDVFSGTISAGWGVMLMVYPKMLDLTSYEQFSRNLERVNMPRELFGALMLCFGLFQAVSIFRVNGEVRRFVHHFVQLGGCVTWGFIALMFWTVPDSPLSTAIVVYTVLALAMVWAFIEFGRR